MTQPLGSSQGTPHPLFSLPRELLLEITTLVNTGDTPRAAAINAVRWRQVSCLTHLITHESSVEGAINQARERHESDKALVVMWRYFVIVRLRQIGMLHNRNADALERFTAREIRSWMADPNHMTRDVLLDFEEMEFANHGMKVIPPEINTFHSLQTLCLERNRIIQITPQTFTNVPSLRKLILRNNQIAKIYPKAFARCRWLRDLDLTGNQLTQIDDQTFAGCSRLQKLLLTSNQITQIASHVFIGCPDLQELDLGHNPLLCSLNPDKFYGLVSVNTFSRYACRSEWAAFHKALSEGGIPMSEVVERLKLLEDRNLIYEMVYWEAKEAVERGGQVFSDGGDHQWGENHVCDNEAVLYRALKRAVREKFERLTAEQKCAVHRRICEVDDDLRWTELYRREKNVLRFIDAMADL